MPIDVQELGCDMLAVTGRKFLRGPRGTGLLYVRKDILENLIPPFLDLHAADWTGIDKFVIRKDAKRFEGWERYVAGQIGLAKAIDYILELGIENIWNRIQSLALLLRSKLNQLENVSICDLGQYQCGIVSFSVKGKNPEDIKGHLLRNKINISVSNKKYTLLDMEARKLEQVLRASVHYYNNEEEVDRFVDAIKNL